MRQLAGERPLTRLKPGGGGTGPVRAGKINGIRLIRLCQSILESGLGLV
jgi:hypothetical protein